mmetsp:Transcript_44833/g.126623  ORF Transcript_44833/g.126623 Transcript_44833/m.126623 type:complete len:81 (-) Transcript_44833:537-779(-)
MKPHHRQMYVWLLRPSALTHSLTQPPTSQSVSQSMCAISPLSQPRYWPPPSRAALLPSAARGHITPSVRPAVLAVAPLCT